jgi:hypothetical protein
MRYEEKLIDQWFPVMGDVQLALQTGNIDPDEAHKIAQSQRDQTVQSFVEWLQAIIVDTANGYRLCDSSTSQEAWTICSHINNVLQEVQREYHTGQAAAEVK